MVRIKRAASLMILAFILLLPVVTLAGTVELPETGQTACYNSEVDEMGYQYSVISCTGTGQDGDIRAGAAWPIPRFSIGRLLCHRQP